MDSKIVLDKRTVEISHNYMGLWVMTINLWAFDFMHRDTCLVSVTSTRPTEREVRKFKKEAKLNFRQGVRGLKVCQITRLSDIRKRYMVNYYDQSQS